MMRGIARTRLRRLTDSSRSSPFLPVLCVDLAAALVSLEGASRFERQITHDKSDEKEYVAEAIHASASK